MQVYILPISISFLRVNIIRFVEYAICVYGRVKSIVGVRPQRVPIIIPLIQVIISSDLAELVGICTRRRGPHGYGSIVITVVYSIREQIPAVENVIEPCYPRMTKPIIETVKSNTRLTVACTVSMNTIVNEKHFAKWS